MIQLFCRWLIQHYDKVLARHSLCSVNCVCVAGVWHAGHVWQSAGAGGQTVSWPEQGSFHQGLVAAPLVLSLPFLPVPVPFPSLSLPLPPPPLLPLSLWPPHHSLSLSPPTVSPHCLCLCVSPSPPFSSTPLPYLSLSFSLSLSLSLSSTISPLSVCLLCHCSFSLSFSIFLYDVSSSLFLSSPPPPPTPLLRPPSLHPFTSPFPSSSVSPFLSHFHLPLIPLHLPFVCPPPTLPSPSLCFFPVCCLMLSLKKPRLHSEWGSDSRTRRRTGSCIV